MKKLQVKIAEQTLNLLKKNEWESISIDRICKQLKLSKKKISSEIKNKNDLIKNINKYFDDFIFVEIRSIEKSNPRDMIFEIFMLRFDLLNRYRSSIIKIFKFFKSHPNHFINFLPSLVSSIEIMVKLSNIQTKDITGIVKLNGLVVIFFSTFLTWINDESDSLDKTMNVLNNYLVKAENILRLLKK